MEHILFYSWVSDLKDKINKGFIRDAIRKAKKKVENEKKIKIYIDEATRDELGSVHIGRTIEAKIRQADIFICDVSTINKNSKFRKTPNPNVLYELGLASETVNWDSIIMINNTAQGRIDDLPFDIKFRRGIEYRLSDKDLNDKIYLKSEKEKLINKLYEALKILPYIKPKLRLREIVQNLKRTKWEAFNLTEGKIKTDELKGIVYIDQEYHNIFTLKFEAYEPNGRFESGDWEARFFINQETLTTADLAFRTKTNFDFKRLIFSLDRQYEEIYIVGQADWGKQVLIKKGANTV